MLKYYWIILVLFLFVKLLKDKKLSSYSIKWLVFYAVYVVWMQAEWEFHFDSKYFDEEEFIWLFFLLPFFIYILFSLFYRKIEQWKVVKQFDKWIDVAYNKIKELC